MPGTTTKTAPVADWIFGEHVLHQDDATHFSLYGPDDQESETMFYLPYFLAEHGIGEDWVCEFSSIGEVLVTEFAAPSTLA